MSKEAYTENCFDMKKALLVKPKKLKSRLVCIRLRMSMIKKLRMIAVRKDCGYQTLLKQFVTEGIEKDREAE